jgi:hypothetical protein
MTDLELATLNEEGFIPGPFESLPLFEARVAKTKEVLKEKNSLPSSHWDWAKRRLDSLFGFDPQSLSVFYSNEQLSLWQGAACWIDEMNVPILQLKNGFKKGTYLKIYSRDEVLAHEAVHAARAAFNEEENEEFFAYATSGVRWRCLFGPMIRRSWEPWIGLGFLSVGLISPWALLGAAGWIGGGFFRLCRQHLRLSQASNILLETLQDKKNVRSLLFRLTDKEIRDLSSGIWPKDDGTLRWRLIRFVYLKKTAADEFKIL